MVFQPAAGTRDLNPQQVKSNQILIKNLANLYKLWGYEEVSPPIVERISTLMAAGAISRKDIINLVSDDPLGLRPEMTASIARAACTRLKLKPRPLRLSSFGSVFKLNEGVENSLLIEEDLQSGVELLGANGIEAEMELLSIMLEAVKLMELRESNEPTLLISHTSLMKYIISNYHESISVKIRKALINYDILSINQLDIKDSERNLILRVHENRGDPTVVLDSLIELYGEKQEMDILRRLFDKILPIAKRQGVRIQLDPTFQPYYNLYTGIVFELVCQGKSAPIVIASGGRYDELMKKFGAKKENASGVGFSISVDKIRELSTDIVNSMDKAEKILVAYSNSAKIESAINRVDILHSEGKIAELELLPCDTKESAEAIQRVRGCNELVWVTR